MQTIFGQDAQRAANIIFGDGTAVYNRMVKAVSRQGGAAKQAAAQNKGSLVPWTGSSPRSKPCRSSSVPSSCRCSPVIASGGEWLSDTENQKRLLEGLKDANRAVVGAVNKLVTAFEALNTIAGSLKGTIKLLGAPTSVCGW